MLKKQIIKWTLIGLLVRLLIMPFTFLGPDIFFINYFPFKFIEQGDWDPYLFLTKAFPHVGDSSYLPLAFIIHSFFLCLLKPLLPKLRNLFEIFEPWKFIYQGNTVHFANVLSGQQLFRTLFILKLPYLIFDFAIGWFLFRILDSDKNKAILGYKCWVLNPFVLFVCYILGQDDIITAFFVMAAIFCAHINKRYWAMVMLSLGILTKAIPLITIPFAVLILGDSFQKRLKLSIVSIITVIVLIAPFYFSSGAIIKSVFFSPTARGAIPLLRLALFVGGYLTILGLFFFAKKQSQIDLGFLITSFISVLLLFYSTYIVTIRYFISVIPLLIYAAIKNKKFWIYNIIFLITLFELRVAGNWQQLAAFSPLHPEFFSSLPPSDSFLNLLMEVKYIHQLMFRLFFVSSLAMIVHIFVLNRTRFGLFLKTDQI